MIIEITGNVAADEKVRRYVSKTIGSLDAFIPRADRADARATVRLQRVDRAHGNKYEASATIDAGMLHLSATDSTLNVLAALDIVRRKLALHLKNKV